MLKVIDLFFHHITDKGRFKPNILTQVETVDYILKHHCNIARYGDGEFSMMLKRRENIGFQKVNEALSAELLDVFIHPNKNVLVCIPRLFDWKDRIFLNRTGRRFWSRYLKRQTQDFYDLMRTHSFYGDTEISRPYIDHLKFGPNRKRSQQLFDKVRQLWEGKRVLLLEGELTRFGVGNTLLDNTTDVGRILCPATNCWSVVDEIENTAQKVAQNYDLILMALGPTATILANRFAPKGIWALDIGHLDIEYEWFKMGVWRKTHVAGKFVNEVREGDEYIPTNENTPAFTLYREQVIARVGI